MAPQTAISKAVCYKTKNEQFWEKAVHFLLVATNCFLHHYPITGTIRNKKRRLKNRLCAPPGARTLDPNIKSVVLYQLS